MTNDPANYRRCSAPYPSVEEANTALRAFFAEVAAARERHRISDVIVICEVPHVHDGKEQRGSALAHHGDSGRILPMLARAFGEERRRFDEAIATLVGGDA